MFARDLWKWEREKKKVPRKPHEDNNNSNSSYNRGPNTNEKKERKKEFITAMRIDNETNAKWIEQSTRFNWQTNAKRIKTISKKIIVIIIFFFTSTGCALCTKRKSFLVVYVCLFSIRVLLNAKYNWQTPNSLNGK